MTPEQLLARATPPSTGPHLVALSGGPDSAVAAWVAARLAPEDLRAVHVHHETAAADVLAKAAVAVAEELQLPLQIVRVSVADGPSWEGNAREARWAALRAAADSATVITGHHADDLAETTLANLARGAGAAGLAAMASPRQGVWRPLLTCSRDEVVAVAAALGLPSAADPANEDTRHRRNLLRHEVIPYLEERLNPQIRAALVRSARSLAADDALIERFLGTVPLRRDAWGGWLLPASLLVTSEPAMAARLVRRLLRAARPPYAGTTAEIDAAVQVATGVATSCEIADGWHIELEGPWLVAHRGEVASPAAVDLEIGGSAVAFGALTVAARPARLVAIGRASRVDAGALPATLTIRSATVGERIEIDAGSKPIREAMAEADIPRRLRTAWPVAVADGRIGAIVGVRAAPWARAVAGEPGAVELTVEEG